MARTYAHLFLSAGCEAPGCSAPRCDIFLTNGGRNAVRACCERHAEEAERHLQQLEESAARERRAA